MNEFVSGFPFPRLSDEKYLTLEIMMYVDYFDSLIFMFSLNKATRIFVESNASTIRNGFINDGLYDYQLNCDFFHYFHLDRLYFRILKRNMINRIVTLSVDIISQDEFDILNEAVKWIND